jgi:uncharacterized protein (UPF0332 family)
VDSRDFLTLARQLAKGSDEAALRTAVSRAYYALFNHIVGFYESKGIKWDSTEQIHLKTQNCLAGCGQVDVAKLSVLLGSIRADRKRADYNMKDGSFCRKNTSQAVILNVEFCLQKFDKHREASVAGARRFYNETCGYPKTW